MVNYKRSVLKAITKRYALAYTNRPRLVENLMLLGHSEVHLWSYEGSENGKLKEVSPKGNYKEKCLGLHESTTFRGKPNAFWPFWAPFLVI